MTGFYITKNGGRSWDMVNLPGSANCFAFDPKQPEVIYAAGAVLRRSVDGGKTWNIIFPSSHALERFHYHGDHADVFAVSADNFPAGEVNFRAIRVNPEDSRRIYAAIDHRLFCTDNYGETWALISGISDTILTVHCLADSVYVLGKNQVYSFDRAAKKVMATPLPAGLAPLVWATGGFMPDNKSLRLYALGKMRRENGEIRGGVFVSEDNGATWTERNQGLGGSLPDSGKLAPEWTQGYRAINCAEYQSATAYLVCDRDLQLRPDGKRGVWFGILKTADAGKTWNWVYRSGGAASRREEGGQEAKNVRDSWVKRAFGNEFNTMFNVGIAPHNPDEAIFTDWYRVMKTENGGQSWKEAYSELRPDGTASSRGTDVTTCYGIHFDPFDRNHLAISYTDIGLFHSFNNGRSWIRSVNGIERGWTNTCYWLVFDPEVKNKAWSGWSGPHDFPRLKMMRRPDWATRGRGGMAVSVDGARTWKSSNDGMPAHAKITSIVLDPASPKNQRTLFCTAIGTGVYKSTDDGKTWALKNQGLGENLAAWEITRGPDGALYLVVTTAPQYTKEKKPTRTPYFGETYVSRDQAESWQKLELPDGVYFPNSLTPDQAQPDRLYLSCWSDITLEEYLDRSVRAEMGENRDIPALGGVYVSEDRGKTWKNLFDDSFYVYGLAVDPRIPGRLYINTFCNAAFRSDDRGQSWKKLKGYSFQWGQRPVIDPDNPDMLYLTTFGGSVFHGPVN
jgi:photosystem II stability/assembly factor-like uncharacterized protein